MNFKPALNLTEQIADHLAQLVIHGTLHGGDRIQELKVARDLDVSRGSVREALLILERRHLIEIVPRRGAIVNSVDREDAMALAELLASAEQHWLRRILVRHPDAPGLQSAAAAIGEMENAAREKNSNQLLQARAQFYMQILKCANKYTRAVFECLLPSSQLVMRKLLESAAIEPHDIARYYRALYSALLDQDQQRLDELLNAFHKRMQHLCNKSLSSINSSRFEAPVNGWATNVAGTSV